MFKVVYTADGSPTVIDERHNSTYHSMHGSVQESLHVFIKNGLQLFLDRSDLSILEIGFGTGLNALLTIPYARFHAVKVSYTAYELYPIDPEILNEFNYRKHTPDLDYDAVFPKLHKATDGTTTITDHFILERRLKSFTSLKDKNRYDLVYMDAFGPGTQEEFWKKPFLTQLADSIKIGGVLVTYCAQGQFKRELKSLGFSIERLAGPPGKREMTRATKLATP